MMKPRIPRIFVLLCVVAISSFTIYVNFTNSPSETYVYISPLENGQMSNKSNEFIIIDQRFWNNASICADRIRVLVNRQTYRQSEAIQTFKILFYEDDPKKDYLLIHDDVERIVLKFKTKNITEFMSIPENTTQFDEFWKRSELKKSLKLDMKREKSTPVIPNSLINVIANLRNYLIGEGIYPLIASGTLLGWYREGTFITHTMDADMMANASQISDYDFLKRFAAQNDPAFKLITILGLPHDSFEIKVQAKNGPSIDIFGVYTTSNGTWVGGSNSVEKYRYDHIKLDKICAADLLDHLMFVPCEVEQWLTVEYGPEWRKDWNTNNYEWYSSQSNVRPNGEWTNDEKEEMKNKWNTETIWKAAGL